MDVYSQPEEALAGSEGLCAACVMAKDLRALQDVREHQRDGALEAQNSKKFCTCYLPTKTLATYR